MSGKLHQVHVEYAPAEDRLLLKFNTVNREELRFWLTRKFVKTFWDALQKLLGDTGGAGAFSDPVLRKAMVGLEQERAAPAERFAPVSYTHLDVYKRQITGCSRTTASPCRNGSSTSW